MFGANARKLPNPLLRFARTVADLLSPARTFADHTDSTGAEGVAGAHWLRISNWIVAGVLGLSLAGIAALSFLEPSSTARYLARHRAITIFILAAVEFALIVAIILRDRQRWNVQQLLRENEERMMLAAGAADVGLWRWDTATDRVWMTDHCRRIFAVASGSSLGMAAISTNIHPEDLEAVSVAVNEARRKGASFDVKFRLATGGGQVRWLRGRGRPETGGDGTLLRVAGSVVDISEHMTMQAEIDRQRQSLIHLTRVGTVGELSGALAHELNQPLTAILSNAQAIQRMIGREPIDLKELRDAIADIVDDDSRAGDIIQHLRTLLKRGPVRREAVDMRLLVQKTISFVRSELMSRRVAPVITASDEAMTVTGDAVQLQQLLLNLVLNAAEAITAAHQKNGILLINSEIVGAGADRRYHLVVSDTGTGIGPEVMARLFEPFFSTKEHGLGLGLSICRAIVEGHGGSIRADGNEWGGACFHVFLPLSPLGAA